MRIIVEKKKCLQCKRIFTSKDSFSVYDFRKQKFCSRKCYFRFNTGSNHWLWKGGFKTRPDGYIRYSKNDKYVHRAIMEKFLGRKLRTTEHIHHIDGNPKNNEISNLMVLSNSQHRKLENKFAKRNKLGQYA